MSPVHLGPVSLLIMVSMKKSGSIREEITLGGIQWDSKSLHQEQVSPSGAVGGAQAAPPAPNTNSRESLSHVKLCAGSFSVRFGKTQS